MTISIWATGTARAERHAQRCEHRAEAAGQRFARIDTRQDADQGDAYLNRGKESVRVLSQLEGFGGRLVALLGACPSGSSGAPRSARFPTLRKPVEQDQQDNDDDFHEKRVM